MRDGFAAVALNRPPGRRTSPRQIVNGRRTRTGGGNGKVEACKWRRRASGAGERCHARAQAPPRPNAAKELPHRLHRSCRHPDYAAPVARTLAGTGRRARNVGIIRGI